jgi:hypothetical protein
MISLAVGAVLLTGIGLAGWYRLDRTAMVQAVCKAGLPNLSRPKRVDARELGCAVLGPRRRVSGFLESGFEHSRLIVGDRYRLDAEGGIANEAPWLSGTPGFMERGGDGLARVYGQGEEDCGLLRVMRVTVEGWMTVSEGRFGHLGMASREFYADRIVSFDAATREDLSLLPAQSRSGVCRWTGAGWAGVDETEPVADGATMKASTP